MKLAVRIVQSATAVTLYFNRAEIDRLVASPRVMFISERHWAADAS